MTEDLYTRAKRDYDDEAAGVRAELEAAGESERRLRELRVTAQNKAVVIPILTRWLSVVRYWPVAADLLYPYASKAAESEVMPRLITWMRSRPTGYRSAVTADGSLDADELMLGSIADAISRLASPRWADDIVSLAADRSLGSARAVLVLRLARTKHPDVPSVLMDLVDDDAVAHSAIRALAAARHRPALPLLEAKADTAPDRDVRAEARRAVRLLR